MKKKPLKIQTMSEMTALSKTIAIQSKRIEELEAELAEIKRRSDVELMIEENE